MPGYPCCCGGGAAPEIQYCVTGCNCGLNDDFTISGNLFSSASSSGVPNNLASCWISNKTNANIDFISGNALVSNLNSFASTLYTWSPRIYNGGGAPSCKVNTDLSYTRDYVGTYLSLTVTCTQDNGIIGFIAGSQATHPKGLFNLRFGNGFDSQLRVGDFIAHTYEGRPHGAPVDFEVDITPIKWDTNGSAITGGFSYEMSIGIDNYKGVMSIGSPPYSWITQAPNDLSPKLAYFPRVTTTGNSDYKVETYRSNIGSITQASVSGSRVKCERTPKHWGVFDCFPSNPPQQITVIVSGFYDQTSCAPTPGGIVPCTLLNGTYVLERTNDSGAICGKELTGGSTTNFLPCSIYETDINITLYSGCGSTDSILMNKAVLEVYGTDGAGDAMVSIVFKLINTNKCGDKLKGFGMPFAGPYLPYENNRGVFKSGKDLRYFAAFYNGGGQAGNCQGNLSVVASGIGSLAGCWGWTVEGGII